MEGCGEGWDGVGGTKVGVCGCWIVLIVLRLKEVRMSDGVGLDGLGEGGLGGFMGGLEEDGL